MTTRQFAVPTVLRMVPNHLLHEFLTDWGINWTLAGRPLKRRR